MRLYTGETVWDAAVRRMRNVYMQGHRVIVAFSAGKDSMAVLEVAIEAARQVGRLPVEVWMRDEEIMYPGTYEYAKRVANRKEVKFYWLYANQPIINIFNRRNPYYWVFDPLLPPEKWMRKPPPFARKAMSMSIDHVATPENFPPPEGRYLFVAMGLRAAESRQRNMMLLQSDEGVTRGGHKLERHIYPIFDWSDKDVWLAAREFGWDYNHAYDVMARFGVPRKKWRIAPPAMVPWGIPLLQMAARAWPDWFDRLAERLPGVRFGARYGLNAILPHKRVGERWEDAYQRLCIDTAPDWIAERAILYREVVLERHSKHSDGTIHEVAPCPICPAGRVSWRQMTHDLYFGDPFLTNTRREELGYVEPDFFRPGSGKWLGRPII